MSAQPHRIVIIGASLAGLRTAQSLREHGFDATITIVGDEPTWPYDRPPLSKSLFTSPSLTESAFRLPASEDLNLTWVLGVRATSLNPGTRTVTLEDGTTLPFDAAVIATGSRARTLPHAAGPPPGVMTLRTLADAMRLRDALGPDPRHLAVVGGGFLGNELAAAAAGAGHLVRLIMRDDAPLPTLGPAVGRVIANLHQEAGVRLYPRTEARTFTTTPSGQLSGVSTSRGWIPADVVVQAVGDEPNTHWLCDSGLALDPGVATDEHGRAISKDGATLPHVLAVGDVASSPQPLGGSTRRRLGHWTSAVEQAQDAGRLLATGEVPAVGSPVPSFWADIHTAKLRSVGLPDVADEVHVIEQDAATSRLIVEYGRRGDTVGAVTINRTSRLPAMRSKIASTQQRLQQSTLPAMSR